MTVKNRIKAARDHVVKGAGHGTAVDDVDNALDPGRGNPDPTLVYPPAFIKSASAHIARVPHLFGFKHVKEIFGVGDVPVEGPLPPWVRLSLNLRDKSSAKHVSVELKEMLLDLKKKLHNAQIMQAIAFRKNGGMMPVAISDTMYWKQEVEPTLKAFNLTDFAAWVPTLNLQFFFEELELEPVIDKYFPEVGMTSKTVTVPGALARMKAKLETDDATFTAQYNTSSSYQMTAQDAVAHTDISEDLMQDIVPQSGGFDRLRKEVAMAVQRSKEDAIINGDDTDSGSGQGSGHMDSDVAAISKDFRKAFKGLRKRALAASALTDFNGAAPSLALYNAILPLMGKFAKEKGDLLFVLGSIVANKIITGGVPELLTIKDFGANATLQTGVLPKVFGVEQYESEWHREDVNSSGVYASAQTLTTLLLVKKSRFALGKRAPIKIWATPSLASSDKMLLSAKERFSFGGVPQSATEKSVVIATDVSAAM